MPYTFHQHTYVTRGKHLSVSWYRRVSLHRASQTIMPLSVSRNLHYMYVLQNKSKISKQKVKRYKKLLPLFKRQATTPIVNINILRPEQNERQFVDISNSFSWIKLVAVWLKCHCYLFPRVHLTITQYWFRYWLPRKQSPWGRHGAHLGPVGPRWAPCWPHEPWYQGWRRKDDCSVKVPMGLDELDKKWPFIWLDVMKKIFLFCFYFVWVILI